jgi:hypothetical protein
MQPSHTSWLVLSTRKRSRDKHELKIKAKTAIYATDKLGFTIEPKIQDHKN